MFGAFHRGQVRPVQVLRDLPQPRAWGRGRFRRNRPNLGGFIALQLGPYRVVDLRVAFVEHLGDVRLLVDEPERL